MDPGLHVEKAHKISISTVPCLNLHKSNNDIQKIS